MQAVHFGAGNIGRGFIGALLYEEGYQTTFIDVNNALITAINEDKQYHVTLAAENEKSTQITHISAINNQTNPDAVKQAIVEADIITTAIGPQVLPLIAELIADGLLLRAKRKEKPLNIIACENMLGASQFLKGEVFKYISQEDKETCERLYGFPNAAVDRIVPNQNQKNILDVMVEPYFEWVVETKGIKGTKPTIDGLTYVDNLQPYIERKLFTVNTGHIVPAYFGYHKGYNTIDDAMQDAHVLNMLHNVLDETGEALIQAHKFDRDNHEAYKQTIIKRFKNPYISDYVTRVGRNPIRKLGRNDRLISPASMYLKATGKVPQHLVQLISFALRYDFKDDKEAISLQTKIEQQGLTRTLQEVCGLDAESPILQEIIHVM